VERPSEAIDDPVAEAADLVEQAELDVGAASLAAAVGDHDIAYALLLDALGGWRAAGDLLLDALERVEEAPPVVVPEAAPEPLAVPDVEAPVETSATSRRERSTTPLVEVLPMPEPAVEPAVPAAASPSLSVPAPEREDGVVEEVDARSREAPRARFERARRRRRVPRGSAPADAGATIDASSRIAPVVVPEGTAEEYEAWVDRLRERRAELKRAAGEIDLASVHRARTEPGRRPWARDLAPPPW
jgi:hypothetical protein